MAPAMRVPNLGKPLPARFENPEPVHRFTGKIFLKPGNYPVSVNRATALTGNLDFFSFLLFYFILSKLATCLN
jgi:hypothetical protein